MNIKQKLQILLNHETPINPLLFGNLKNVKKISIVALAALTASFLLGVTRPMTALAASPAPVDLQSAGNFVILSISGITDIPSSSITGNIGAGEITGAAIGVTCPEVTGTIYTVDEAGPLCRVVAPSLLTTAVDDMMTAYVDAAGRPSDVTELGGGDISGMTLAPGVYKWSTAVLINADVTLSGSATDVWIFEIAGDLNVASGGSVATGVKVLLTGGAQSGNVFWQVGGGAGAILGTYSTFHGTILSAKAVVLQTGAGLCGKALAQTAVTLDQNVVSDQCTAFSCEIDVVITPSGSTTNCSGNPVDLTASGADTYLWSPGGQTSATIAVTNSGTYSVIGTDTNGCQGTASQTVTMDASPVVSITAGGSTTFCAGGGVTLTASGASSYLWSPGGQTSAAIAVTNSGTYTVIGKNASGCQNTASQTVTVKTAPVVTVTGPTTICAGQSTTLTASGGNLYTWSSGQNTAAITVSPTTTTTYMVTVTGTNGCQKSVQVTVTVDFCGNCPLTQGYWKNHASAWPVSSLTLGTVTYSKAQLLAILRKDSGTGNKSDASLILANQLIAAKLNLANESNSSLIAATIAAADALIGNRTIPILPKFTPNTAQGARMVALAATLDKFNNGRMSPGCTP